MQAVSLLAVMLLSGCAYHSAEFRPPAITDDTRALVYIYRPDRFSNAMLSPTVVIDGEDVFATQSGTYTYLYLMAGIHRFMLESETNLSGNDEVELQLESGQVSYLRVDTALKFEMGKPYSRSFSITHMDKPTALNEIAHCRPQQAQLPSKYRWSGNVQDAIVGKSRPDRPATFTIDKSSDPFAAKRSHE